MFGKRTTHIHESSEELQEQQQKRKSNKEYRLYILLLSGGYFYVGITTELERRWTEHRLGKGPNHTRKRPPKDIVYTSPPYEGQSKALKMENAMTKVLQQIVGEGRVHGGSYV